MTIERELLAKYFHDIFTVDQRGVAILEYLVAKYTRPPVTKGGIDAVLQTFSNAGAGMVLNEIVVQINIHNGVVDADIQEQQQ